MLASTIDVYSAIGIHARLERMMRTNDDADALASGAGWRTHAWR